MHGTRNKTSHLHPNNTNRYQSREVRSEADLTQWSYLTGQSILVIKASSNPPSLSFIHLSVEEASSRSCGHQQNKLHEQVTKTTTVLDKLSVKRTTELRVFFRLRYLVESNTGHPESQIHKCRRITYNNRKQLLELQFLLKFTR